MTHTPYRPAISIGTGLGEDKNLLHVPAAKRGEAGQQIADYVDHVVRTKAMAGGEPMTSASRKPLCPGCTGVLIVNAVLALANKYKWPPAILRKIGHALHQIADTGQTQADYTAAKLERLRVMYDHGDRHLTELGAHGHKTHKHLEPVPSSELTQEERDAEQWGATFYQFKQPGHEGYEEA